MVLQSPLLNPTPTPDVLEKGTAESQLVPLRWRPAALGRRKVQGFGGETGSGKVVVALCCGQGTPPPKTQGHDDLPRARLSAARSGCPDGAAASHLF